MFRFLSCVVLAVFAVSPRLDAASISMAGSDGFDFGLVKTGSSETRSYRFEAVTTLIPDPGFHYWVFNREINTDPELFPFSFSNFDYTKNNVFSFDVTFAPLRAGHHSDGDFLSVEIFNSTYTGETDYRQIGLSWEGTAAAPATVPLPAGFPLLFAGLAGLAGLRRFKNADCTVST